MSRGLKGVACSTDDILSGAVCALTTSRGIKTLTHLKRPPGLRGAPGGSACRHPSRSSSHPLPAASPSNLPFSVLERFTPLLVPIFLFFLSLFHCKSRSSLVLSIGSTAPRSTPTTHNFPVLSSTDYPVPPIHPHLEDSSSIS